MTRDGLERGVETAHGIDRSGWRLQSGIGNQLAERDGRRFYDEFHLCMRSRPVTEGDGREQEVEGMRPRPACCRRNLVETILAVKIAGGKQGCTTWVLASLRVRSDRYPRLTAFSNIFNSHSGHVSDVSLAEIEYIWVLD